MLGSSARAPRQSLHSLPAGADGQCHPLLSFVRSVAGELRGLCLLRAPFDLGCEHEGVAESARVENLLAQHRAGAKVVRLEHVFVEHFEVEPVRGPQAGKRFCVVEHWVASAVYDLGLEFLRRAADLALHVGVRLAPCHPVRVFQVAALHDRDRDLAGGVHWVNLQLHGLVDRPRADLNLLDGGAQRVPHCLLPRDEQGAALAQQLLVGAKVLNDDVHLPAMDVLDAQAAGSALTLLGRDDRKHHEGCRLRHCELERRS
mmetsp:Transcript_42766/g.99004  ORF Transcript_42766/g.99004 Transcript_42766/m.99004 type:complete len:259 (+) Transcript_42766:1328-2104(+)